ncbi:2991_t:CDS:2, partial [Paraglomus occultum]
VPLKRSDEGKELPCEKLPDIFIAMAKKKEPEFLLEIYSRGKLPHYIGLCHTRHILQRIMPYGTYYNTTSHTYPRYISYDLSEMVNTRQYQRDAQRGNADAWATVTSPEIVEGRPGKGLSNVSRKGPALSERVEVAERPFGKDVPHTTAFSMIIMY